MRLAHKWMVTNYMADTLFPQLKKLPQYANASDDDIVDLFQKKLISIGKNPGTKDKATRYLYEKFGDNNPEVLAGLKSKEDTANEMQARDNAIGTAPLEQKIGYYASQPLMKFAQGTVGVDKFLMQAFDFAIPDGIAKHIPIPTGMFTGWTNLKDATDNSIKMFQGASDKIEKNLAPEVRTSLFDKPKEMSRLMQLGLKVPSDIVGAIPDLTLMMVGAEAGAAVQLSVASKMAGAILREGGNIAKATVGASLGSNFVMSSMGAVNDYNVTSNDLKQKYPDLSDEQISQLAGEAGRKSFLMNTATNLLFEHYKMNNIVKMSGMIPTKGLTKQAGLELADKVLQSKPFLRTAGQSVMTGLQTMSQMLVSNMVTGHTYDWKDYADTFAGGVFLGLASSGIQPSQAGLRPEDLTKRTGDIFMEEVNSVKNKYVEKQNLVAEATAVAEGTTPEFIKQRQGLENKAMTLRSQLDFWRNLLNETQPDSPQFEQANRKFGELNTSLTDVQSQLTELLQQKPELPSQEATAKGNAIPDLQEMSKATPKPSVEGQPQVPQTQPESPSEPAPAQTEGATKVTDNKVVMPKQEAVDEHKQLVETLRSGDPEKLKAEADKQEQELQQYQGNEQKVETPQEPSDFEKLVINSHNILESGVIPAKQDVVSLYNELTPKDKQFFDDYFKMKHGKTIEQFNGMSPQDPAYKDAHSFLAGAIGKYLEMTKFVVDTNVGLHDKVKEKADELIAYHGTTKDFTDFKVGKEGGIFFTPDKDVAEAFTFNYDENSGAGGNIRKVKLNFKNPKVIDMKGSEKWTWKDEIDKAKAEGHDGLIIKNSIEIGSGTERPVDQYVAFDNSSIKPFYSTEKANNQTKENKPANTISYSKVDEKMEQKPKKMAFAVMDSDGNVYYDNTSKSHYDVAESAGLNTDVILDSGWMVDGKYVSGQKIGGAMGGQNLTQINSLDEVPEVKSINGVGDEIQSRIAQLKADGNEVQLSTDGTHLIHYPSDSKFSSDDIARIDKFVSGIPLRSDASGRLLVREYQRVAKSLGFTPESEGFASIMKVFEDFKNAPKEDNRGNPGVSKTKLDAPEMKQTAVNKNDLIDYGVDPEIADIFAESQDVSVNLEQLNDLVPSKLNPGDTNTGDYEVKKPEAEFIGGESSKNRFYTISDKENPKKKLNAEIISYDNGERQIIVNRQTIEVSADDASLTDRQILDKYVPNDKAKLVNNKTDFNMSKDLAKPVNPAAEGLYNEIIRARQDAYKLQGKSDVSGRPKIDDETTKTLIEQYKLINVLSDEVKTASEGIAKQSASASDINEAVSLENALDVIQNHAKKVLAGDVSKENVDGLNNAIKEYNKTAGENLTIKKLFPTNLLTKEQRVTVGRLFNMTTDGKSTSQIVDEAKAKLRKQTGGQVLSGAVFGIPQPMVENAIADGIKALKKLKFDVANSDFATVMKHGEDRKLALSEGKRKAELFAMNFFAPQTWVRYDKTGVASRALYGVVDIKQTLDRLVNDIHGENWKKLTSESQEVRDRIHKADEDGNLYHQEIPSYQMEEMFNPATGGRELKRKKTVTVKNGKEWTDDELRQRYNFNEKEIGYYRTLREQEHKKTQMNIDMAIMAGVDPAKAKEMYSLEGYTSRTRGDGDYQLWWEEPDSETGYGYMSYDNMAEAIAEKRKLIQEGKITPGGEFDKITHKDKQNLAKYQRMMTTDDLFHLLNSMDIDKDITNDPVVQALVKEINSRNYGTQNRIQRRRVPMRISSEKYFKLIEDHTFRVSKAYALSIHMPRVIENINSIDPSSPFREYLERYITNTVYRPKEMSSLNGALRNVQKMVYYGMVGNRLSSAAINLTQPYLMYSAYLRNGMYGLSEGEIFNTIKDGEAIGARHALGLEGRIDLPAKMEQRKELIDNFMDIHIKRGTFDTRLHEQQPLENNMDKLQSFVGKPFSVAETKNRVQVTMSATLLAYDNLINKAKGNITLAKHLGDIAGLEESQLADINRSISPDEISKNPKVLNVGGTPQEVAQLKRSEITNSRMNELVEKIYTGNLSEAEKRFVAWRFGERANHETNMLYGQLNTPQWIAKQKGTVGQLLRSGYMFKGFNKGVRGFMASQIITGKWSPAKTALSLLPFALAGGYNALIPGWDDIKDLLRLSGAIDPEQELRSAFESNDAYQLASHGIPMFLGDQYSFDLSSRIGFGRIMPNGMPDVLAEMLKFANPKETGDLTKLTEGSGKVLLNYFGGAPFAMSTRGAESVQKAFDAFESGNTQSYWQNIIPNVIPLAMVQDFYEGINVAKNGLRSNSGELIKKDVSAPQAIIKAFGFQTGAEVKNREMKNALNFDRDRHNSIISFYNKRIAEVISSPDMPDEKREQRWNELKADIVAHNIESYNKGKFWLVYNFADNRNSVRNMIGKSTIEDYSIKSGGNSPMNFRAYELSKQYK